MTTSSEWGKLAYRYAQLPAADGVTYGIQNSQFVAVPSGGGGGSVTKENFEEYCASGYFGARATGVWYPPVGAYVQVSTYKEMAYLAPAETRAFGDFVSGYFFGSGAGAGVIGTASSSSVPRATTGTSATGSTKLYIEPGVANVSRSDLSSMSFSFSLDVDALSTSAQRMLVSCMLRCGDLGDVTFSLVDNVNAGNFVVTYFNSSNALVTVNTAKTLVAGVPKLLRVTATKSAGTWTMVVDFDEGAAAITTTNNQANATTAVGSAMGVLDATVTKSVGTTARSMAVDGVYVICT